MVSVGELLSRAKAAIASDTPLRLDVAAKIAFPRGGMTAAGLRRESKRGRLVIERVAGKDYTTLDHIAEMRKLCQLQRSRPDFGKDPRAEIRTAISLMLPSGLSLMEVASSALDAALTTSTEQTRR
jgi:hypothetical protein